MRSSGSTAYPVTSARPALKAGSSAAMSSGRCMTAAGVPPNRRRIASESRSDGGRAWGDRRKRIWDSRGRNEQKHGVAALDRAQLPGSLKGHADAHAVVKKTEWHFHERLEYMLQLLDVNGGS